MPVKGRVEGKSQNGKRLLETVYDQHRSSRFPTGRPWWGWTEIPANAGELSDFCMELVPGDTNDPNNSSWHAPWVPGPDYLRPNIRARQLIIKYDLIRSYYQREHEVYYEKAVDIAYRKGWEIPNPGAPMTAALAYLLGKAPISPKVADAAMAGDPWLLGFSDDVNQPLADLILGRPEQAFAHSPLLDVARTPDGRQATPSDVMQFTPDELLAFVNRAMDQREQDKTNDRMAKLRQSKAKKTETASAAP